MESKQTSLADELLALVEARRELSVDDERFLVDTFLHRLEAQIDARVQALTTKGPAAGRSDAALMLLVLVLAIPLSAIAGDVAGIWGLIICWGALVSIACTYLGTRH